MKIYNALYKTKTDKKYVTPEGVEVMTPKEAQALYRPSYMKYYGNDSPTLKGQPWANQGVDIATYLGGDLFLVNTSVFPPKMYHVIPTPKPSDWDGEYPLITLDEVEAMGKNSLSTEEILILVHGRGCPFTLYNNRDEGWTRIDTPRCTYKNITEFLDVFTFLDGAVITIIDRRVD